MESIPPLSEVVSLPALSTGKHNLEEGDQLVILNALDVMYNSQQSILDVFSVDTDVFALLTAHFSLIPPSTTLIRRGGEQIYIQETYMKLGRKRAEALVLPTTDYFWELVDGSLKPVFCTESLAPQALIELRKCNWKTGCLRNSCSCKKNNLKCTDMCRCGDTCQNVYPDRPVDVDGTEELCKTIIRSTNIYINERSFRDLVYVSRTHDMGIDCLFWIPIYNCNFVSFFVHTMHVLMWWY